MFNHIVRAYELLLEPQIGTFRNPSDSRTEVYHRDREAALAAAVHRGVAALGKAATSVDQSRSALRRPVTIEAGTKG